MILCDTSPLIALINSKDPGHARCAAALPSLSAPLITTWSCFTEAMYLARRYGGWSAQQEIWSFIEAGLLVIRSQSSEEQAEMQRLMLQYRDKPMDLADASLVAAANALNQRQIFTLDSDFYTYRFKGNQAFEIIPDNA